VDWVLEHLKEDLSVKRPAYEPTPEDEALGDDHVAAKFWESYKRANPVLIANLVRASTTYTAQLSPLAMSAYALSTRSL
jgi:hypothetical protein